MLQQPSDRVMCQKFPVDLNMQSSESSSLQSDLKQLQAQRPGAPTHAFFLDAYRVNAAVPAPSASVGRVAEMLQPAICLQNAYAYPFEAACDPFFRDRQQFYHHQHQKFYNHFPNHQQQQNQVWPEPFSDTELCQQQRRQQLQKQGCWFPNWQEVFDGFAPREEMRVSPSSFQQQQPKQDATTFPSPVVAASSTIAHQTKVHGDGSQITDLKPDSSPLSKQNVASLPHSSVDELQNGVLERAEANCDSEFPSASSSLATAIVLSAPPLQEDRSENALVPFTDPENLSSPHPGGKYITQSPAWLPPGWITEVQTRQSGSTAGARDKYYKDLVSGRRFRSRNEVIHYLETGKGRLKRQRCKQGLSSTATGGRFDCYTHHPHIPVAQQTFHPCLLLAPQPIEYKLGPIMNTETVSNPPSGPHVFAHGEETSCQFPAANANVGSTGGRNHHPEEQSSQIFLSGSKHFLQSRPQKLPIFKKAKVMSPNKPEDKQASRFWQWLQKSAVTSGQPQKRPGVVDEQNALDTDMDRDVQFDKRKSELCRDVETGQKTIAQLGKELQATIEKLAQRVQTGKEDLKLKKCGFQKADDAASNVMQATCRLDGAIISLTEAVQSLVVELDNTIQVSQALSPNLRMASPSAKQSPAPIGIERKTQSPNMSTVQLPSSNCTAHASGCINHATFGTRDQQSQIQDVAMCNTVKIPEFSVIFTHYRPSTLSTGAVLGIRSGITQNTEKFCGTKQDSIETDEQIPKQRRIHIHKFPVLNPTLDLSSLSPNLSSRQRAKKIQKMKAKYARGFLVVLGRKICYEAISQNGKKWC